MEGKEGAGDDGDADGDGGAPSSSKAAGRLDGINSDSDNSNSGSASDVLDEEDNENGNLRGLLINKGNFVFFMAKEALFLMGKVLDLVNGEVHVHWYSPVNKATRANAATLDAATYGQSTFGADFSEVVEATVKEKRKCSRHVPDTDHEPASHVVAHCEKINASGKKIPANILTQLSELHKINVRRE